MPPKLKDHEMICSKCDGQGYDEALIKCPKCLGDGKLDWVENVVGKNSKPENPMNFGIFWHEASDTPPPGPSSNDAYINTKDNSMYVYDGKQWVNIGPL